MAKKSANGIVIGILVLVVLIGGGIYFLGSNLDSMVRNAIEQYGSAATLTTVKLDHVKIGLQSGEASLGGFSMGKPDGYEADPALAFGDVSVKLDTKSLAGTGPIVIKDVTISKPQITYEINTSGQSNMQAIVKNTQAYAASFAGKGGTANASADGAAKQAPARKVIINSLTIQDGEIGISSPVLKGHELSAPLPVIHLTNLGKDEGGATPAEITEKVLGAITSSASSVAQSALVQQIGADAKLVGKTMMNNAGDAVKGLFGK